MNIAFIEEFKQYPYERGVLYIQQSLYYEHCLHWSTQAVPVSMFCLSRFSMAVIHSTKLVLWTLPSLKHSSCTRINVLSSMMWILYLRMTAICILALPSPDTCRWPLMRWDTSKYTIILFCLPQWWETRNTKSVLFFCFCQFDNWWSKTQSL